MIKAESWSESMPSKGEGQAFTDDLQGSEDGLLTAIGHGDAFRPASGDTDGVQGMNVLPAGRVAAVGHQVQFQEAWLDVIPISEGAHRDRFLDQGARLGCAEPR